MRVPLPWQPGRYESRPEALPWGQWRSLPPLDGDDLGHDVTKTPSHAVTRDRAGGERMYALASFAGRQGRPLAGGGGIIAPRW